MQILLDVTVLPGKVRSREITGIFVLFRTVRDDHRWLFFLVRTVRCDPPSQGVPCIRIRIGGMDTVARGEIA